MSTRTRDFPDEFISVLDPAGKESHLDRVREVTGVEVMIRGNHLSLKNLGDGDAMTALSMLEDLYESWERDGELTYQAVKTNVNVVRASGPLWRGPRGEIRPRTEGQAQYVRALDKNTITCASGPAGTGKTFLAIVHAVKLLKAGAVDKIVLSRPVVESGENLGFLPGTLEEKIDPYMRPLYDSLAECLPAEEVDALIERKVIEISPLAYMRGRTLKKSYIILDEGSNATPSQMKLLLTRIGEGSRIVITGDPNQSDIRGVNGLVDFVERVNSNEPVKGIDVASMTNDDIIRHPLVGPLLRLYGE